ncbi:MAG: DUF116 domain-containing protein [candidate division Zixibacteria bacterium]|nr:DUF116 domain-containing protein [candidate division Zixibacteria bacterium]
MSKPAPTYCLGPDFYNKLIEFVARFQQEGYDLFSEEFAQLDEFIAAAHTDQSDRTDKGLRRTPKIKYLLEAVSFKIYDQLNRDRFNQAKRTVIVLPDCLNLHNPDCLKTDEKWGDQCQQCVDNCQANEVVELAEQYGIEVVFSKRKLTEQIKHFSEKHNDLGVIGIGCLLMLAEGMRSAADAGVPARGVLLNFTGCEHWNDEPFASEFPLDQLKTILEEKYG